MAPKFKGDGDDWLDADEVSAKAAPNKKRIPRKKNFSTRDSELPDERANGTVAEVFPNSCRVTMDVDAHDKSKDQERDNNKGDSEGGEKVEKEDLLCSYRHALVVKKTRDDYRERTPVAVGDRVYVVSSGKSQGVIEGICRRRNILSRPAPGRDTEKFQHVLAANIDLLVIVASCQDPAFSPGFIDRLLVRSELDQIPALICVTKMDLHADGKGAWKIYPDLGYEVMEVSTQAGTHMEALSRFLKGKAVVFCGPSGVGKTSLLRVLLGTDVGRIGEVNEFTRKGRHTTTGAVLFGGPDRSRWIDTPGIREFGLFATKPEEIASCFPEFRDLECTGQGCLHLDEPACQARGLPRYGSYRRIVQSLVEDQIQAR